MRNKIKILVYMVGLALAITICYPSTMNTAKAADNPQAGTEINQLDSKKPSEFDAYKKSGVNPYGYGVDQVFRLVTKNELALYHSYNVATTGSVNSTLYTGYYNSQKENASITSNFGGSQDINENGNTLSFTESIAYEDPTNVQEQNVCYVGFAANGHLSYWTQDFKGQSVSTIKEITTDTVFSSSSDIDSTADYEATAYLAVASGDYDGDGKDSILVAVTAKNGVGIYEIEQNGTIVKRMQIAGIDGASNKKGYLNVDMTSGDFNGDGTDDFGIITAYGKQDDNGRATAKMYMKYGKKGEVISGTADIGKEVSQNGNSVFAPGISSGDMNLDGKDEIVVAGLQTDLSGSTADYKEDKTVLACYGFSGNETIVISYQMETSNAWTEAGVYPDADDAWATTGVECFKVDGKASSECVFVNGTVYRLNGSAMEKKYMPGYFNSSDDGASGSVISNTYIKSITSGNLDGNEYGREQVAFVIGLKQQTYDDYYYKLGMIGGSNYEGDKSVGTSNLSICGTSTGFYSNDIDDASYVIADCGDDSEEKLNCLVTAVDSNDDGTVARYKGLKYAYSDPSVETVLQAAPRFDEIGQEAGETTYSQETSYEFETSTSDNVSFGAGVSSEVEISAGVSLKMSGELGYQLDWTKSFTKTLGTSYSTTFVAKSYNSVVIQRTPVYMFTYQLASKNGNWDEEGYKATGKNTIQYAIPQKPVYFQLSIDEYNEYVEEYNKKAEENNVGKNTNDPKYILKLKKIEDAHVMGNEGDPSAYKNDWSVGQWANLSKSSISLGYNGTSATNEWTTSDAYTEGVETSHGFHYSYSLMAGVGVAGNDINVGGYVSLDYAHGTSEYSTTANATTSSGTVNDLDQLALQDEGYSPKTIRGYSFDWNFGTWNLGLSEDGSYTPVFGYTVENCTSPAKPPDEIEVEATGADTLGVNWKAPTNTRNIEGYNIYLLEKGKYIKQNNSVVTDTQYEIQQLESNTEYTVVVTSVTSETDPVERLQGTEGVWSDAEKGTTWKEKYQLDYTLNHATAQVSHLGNVNVQSGDKILERTVITFDMSAKEGYTLDNLSITKNGEKTTIPLTGKRMTYSFELKDNCNVVVNTKKVVDESQVQYGIEPDNSGNVNGSIVANSGGVTLEPPEAQVNNTNVTLEVTPNKGYIVKGWKIDGKEVDSIGQNTLKYYFTKENHEIYAVLSQTNDPAVSSVITVKKPEHGNLIVKTENGSVLSPDANGKIVVQKASKITVSHKADEFYSFKTWEEELAPYGNDEEPITLLVEKDITLGAAFYPPVKYKLSYQKDGGGDISVKDALENTFASGTSYNPGTKVTVNIKANTNYRIKKIEAVRGTKELPITIKKGATEFSYPIELTANTKVKAYFEPLYEVSVQESAAKDSGKGQYGEEDTVTIRAGEKEGFVFDKWEIIGTNVTLKDEKADITTFAMPDSAVEIKATWKPHTHAYATTWSKNSKEHWHASTCGHAVTMDKAAHLESDWIVDKAPTEVLSGSRHRQCTICGYVTKKEKINPTKTGVMLLKGSSTFNTIKLTWSKLKDSDGYEIYGSKCSYKYKKIKVFKNNKITSWKQKNLKAGTGYKYYVRSYKVINGKKTYLRNTADIHVATAYGRYTNAKKLTGTSNVKVKMGKTKKISIKVILSQSYKSTLHHVAKVRYASTNKKIAVVSKTGTITGKKAGTCYVYACAENGYWKKIKVTIV